MIDGIHILAAYLDCTTATFHHAIGHYDVMARTILLKLTSVFQTNGIITTRNMTVGNTYILAMININTITIAYFQIIQKINSIYQSTITAYQMNCPIGTFTNRNITDRQILHTYQREDMRTRIEGCYRFQFIAVKQLCSHKLNTIAMNRTMSGERQIFYILSPNPHHTFTFILTKGTFPIDAFIRIRFPDGMGLQDYIDIRLQFDWSRKECMISRENDIASSCLRTSVDGFLNGRSIICHPIAFSSKIHYEKIFGQSNKRHCQQQYPK